MSIERTVFVIKPEAFAMREQIKNYVIQNSNLTIIRSVEHIMTEHDVEQVYGDDLSTELLDAAKAHLIGNKVEVCIVEGEDAVERFIYLAGKHFDNAKCEPHTIRYNFGRPETVRYGNITYYFNAIHKTTQTEVTSALQWCNALLK